MASNRKSETIDIVEMKQGRLRVSVLGRTPLILARMSEKARHELLLPKGRKTAAEKKGSLKHNPIQEFRDAPYLSEDANSSHLLELLSTAFKKAMMGAAVDIPGAAKAQVGRLVWVEGQRIGVYGTPKLHMSITRSADMNKTPDVRTRCIVPYWAASIDISFAMPIMNEQQVLNLLAAAGLTQGVGDWRPEKGAGNYGQFEAVSDDDSRFIALMKEGREVQDAAMKRADPYDSETEQLLAWFVDEAKTRGLSVVS